MRYLFLFLFFMFCLDFNHFRLAHGVIYKKSSSQTKDFHQNQDNKKTSFNLNRDYPGGVDEEDLKVIKFREPKAKVTKSSLERTAIKNFKKDKL